MPSRLGPRCTAPDWAGGTRIAASLRAFNVEWSRRVTAQNPVVLLFTDGLEREGVRSFCDFYRQLLACIETRLGTVKVVDD